MLKSYNEKLRPYIFHGVSLPNEDSATGDCPFCGKERHFNVNSKTGQFRCVRCETSGNTYTFLQKLYNCSLDATTDSDYDELANQRNLPPRSLQAWGLAKSFTTGNWLIPAYNCNSKLSNLYKVVTAAGNRLKVLSTPNCKASIFWQAQPTAKAVYVCEGVWDAIALSSLLQSELINAIAVPGAGNFQPQWFTCLEGKDTYLLFDNDHPRSCPTGDIVRPGWDGMVRVASLARKATARPSSLRILHWSAVPAAGSHMPPSPPPPGHNPDLPDGYDIRDLVRDHGEGAVALLEKACLPVSLPPENTPGRAAIPCKSFEELCKYYDSALHFTQPLKDTLAVMLAVVVSTELKGDVDQLWLRVIGPPGSGKSTLAEAISTAREWVVPKSVVTGFHSGYVDYDPVTGERMADADLITELHGKTVVMKDGDTLLNASGVHRIMSELRDLYDGSSRAHYRNKVKRDVEGLRMTFILCGTDSLRTLNRTFLGERFLDCEILDICSKDTLPYLQRASATAYMSLMKGAGSSNGSVSSKVALKQATCGFIQHLKASPATTPPSLDNTVLATLEGFAQYISYLRARKPDAELNYRPRVELATRLVSQLVNLSFSLCIVLGKQQADDEVLRIVRKVVKDTSLGFQQEIVTALSTGPMDVRGLCYWLSLPETSVRRLLFDMLEFGIVSRSPASNNSGQRGRDIHYWQLTPVMQQLASLVLSDQPAHPASPPGLLPPAPDLPDDTVATIEQPAGQLGNPQRQTTYKQPARPQGAGEQAAARRGKRVARRR